MINFNTYCSILCIQLITQTHNTMLWKLNHDNTKIVTGQPKQPIITLHDQNSFDDDMIFNYIISTSRYGTDWIKQDAFCSANCKLMQNQTQISNRDYKDSDDEVLDCGKIANFTQYDNMAGIKNRNQHPNIPEPHVSLLFKNKKLDLFRLEDEVDLLEKKLKKIKREKPKSIQLYNQIGNYWRIKGNTINAIECFRKALAVEPHNPQILLNLARVLLTVHYLEDALHLARVSLSVLPNDKAAWQQYFTLGEIFKALGAYGDAIVCLRRSLDMKPKFELAQVILKKVESISNNSIDLSSVLIVAILATLVFWVLGSANSLITYLTSSNGKYSKSSKYNRYK